MIALVTRRSLRPRIKIAHSVRMIDLQQPGHRGAPVPGGRAWRRLTCHEDASASKGRGL
jgi:hypothetical protein